MRKEIIIGKRGGTLDILNGKKKKKAGRSGSKETLGQIIRIGRYELNGNLIIPIPETIS